MNLETSAPTILFSEADSQENKFVAALGYVSIFFLVPLIFKKESPFAQFHAKQGFYLFLAFFVGQLVFWIPLFGWALFVYLLVVNIYALIQALQGKAWIVPGAKYVLEKLNL